MLSDSGQLPLGRPPAPTTPAAVSAAFITPLARPGRSATPSRPATPGDLAPLALAPVQSSGADTRGRSRGQLAQAPPLPAWPSRSSSATALGRLDARQASPLQVTAAAVELNDYEVRLRSLGVRQDGFEQRLTELAGLFAGVTEEQNGQARQLEDLSEECRGSRSRLSEVEDMQKYMTSELKVLTDMLQLPHTEKSKHAHFGGPLIRDIQVGPAAVADRGAGGARKDEMMEVRQDVRALGQALATLRDRVSAGERGHPASGSLMSQLGELGRRVNTHGRRLLALSTAAFQKQEGMVPLRRILCEWHALLNSNASKSPKHALRSPYNSVNLRLLEHDRQLTELHSHAQLHDLRLTELQSHAQLQDLQFAKMDGSLETLRQQRPAPGGLAVPALSSGKLAELLEMVSGQAKAVDDLDFVVRDELRKSHERLAEAEVSQQLVEQIAEQGRAIRDLHLVVQDMGKQAIICPSSAGEDEIAERLADLEDAVASLQQNLGKLAAVVRHVQDHASDALDDRVAAAINEVHGRLTACIASARQQVSVLHHEPQTDTLEPQASSPGGSVDASSGCSHDCGREGLATDHRFSHPWHTWFDGVREDDIRSRLLEINPDYELFTIPGLEKDDILVAAPPAATIATSGEPATAASSKSGLPSAALAAPSAATTAASGESGTAASNKSGLPSAALAGIASFMG